MIASVQGLAREVGLDHVVVSLGPVSLLVHTTPGTAAAFRPGAPCELATSLVVREDSLTLYGFDSDDARTLFETVQTVSGVGPRLALALLAVHTPDVLRTAVAAGDLPTLTRVPGVGTKGAQRLVLELRDRIGSGPAPAGAAASAPPTAPWRSQVREALVGLGWSAKQADDALEAVAPEEVQADVAAVLRAALRKLAKA